MHMRREKYMPNGGPTVATVVEEVMLSCGKPQLLDFATPEVRASRVC